MTWNSSNVRVVATSSRNDYPAILDAAWQDHLALREPDAPTVVSLFAGCGGSSLGYSMAGYRELLAVEWDANAVETFRRNFPGVPVHHGDIRDLSVAAVLEMTGLQPGVLDVLDGSPPCQGFSMIGKRKFDDPRNDLFREYVRLLEGLQPRAFVMENVSGMVKGKMKLIFADILRALKGAGYKVKARLLNAMYFNVPQSRERMIFVGVRDDMNGGPRYPKAQTRPVLICDAISVPPGTVGYITASDERRASRGQRPLRRPNQPMATLVKSGNSRMMAGWRVEPITVHEASRFASFPDAYCWRAEAIQQIGNSVPPLFMRAIACHIRERILAADACSVQAIASCRS